MKRRLSPVTAMLNVIAMMVVIVVGGYIWAGRAESAPLPTGGAGPKFAASASASGVPSIAAPPAPSADAGPPPESSAQLPVDLAIAPDGGVPFHPTAPPTGYRSPFATP